MRIRRPPRPPNHRSSRRARVTGRAGCEWARTPSSPWTTPSRTRRGWSWRSGSAPAPTTRSTTVAVYGGRHPSRIRERARGEHAAGAEVVLEHDGDAGQRARVVAAADRGVDGGRRRPRRLVGDQVAGVQLRLRARTTTAKCSSTMSTADRSPARTRAASSSAGTLTARRGCAERGTGGLRPPEPWRALRRDRGSGAARRDAAR